jgi:hypothetical protein
MKKAIVTLLSAAALGTVLSVPLIANANNFRMDDHDSPIGFRERHHTIYEVYYRRHRHSNWDFYGSYDSRFRAEKAVFHLRLKGYRAYVERR